MKKYMGCLLILLTLGLCGCKDDKPKNTLTFAVSAEYPPFEYYQDGKLTGFDIELAQLIAKELGKKAVFEDMQFSTLLAALQSNTVDAAISTLTMTEDRLANFAFSDPYYTGTLATVFPKEKPVTDQAQLSKMKVCCLLGATMEIWLKTHIPSAEIISMDNSNQVIEALKASHVDVAFMDGIQAMIFSQKNPSLSYAIIAKSDDGYGIAFQKSSPLKDEVNQALKKLKENGKLEKLQKKWLEGTEWRN
ncbi:MAG: amino acid ABC transporter substrate-binding protein [Alphaproteobacteria bacterium 16-39-46]|nr:MAG: amino acid ABC transporter substrate-binding protein [Alphaproteobacteria bacterium 16-39-46]OZA43322.1 MAG: amino acid ABC transporter substrate-binding protein [Alphaproteobacteria bacterium 17-39-52]HQS83926.1 ABC transporter substrate-binding protein [Alphaproteobacteria bacterium]HQS93788.1 ABC transporter substrate-binding protein [Alphaproteobacteria bacterium]